MQVFLAGVMQGSRRDHLIDPQNYRLQIAEALRARAPEVKIVDPWQLHPDSINYDAEQVHHTFNSMTALAAETDLLIAYLPTASMGTAIEMWTAYHARRHIVAVTPLVHNWVVKITADEVFPDLESLLAAIASGRFDHLLQAID